MNIKTILWLIIVVGLAACSRLTNVDQPKQIAWQALNSEGSAGQTFTATYNGLRGIGFYLAPGSSNEGQLRLSLSNRSQAAEKLRQAIFDLKGFQSEGFYYLNFPPIPDSNNQDYYAQIDIKGNGDLKIGSASSDSYQNGATYSNQQPQDAQLTFDLVYRNSLRLLGLAKESLTWVAWILAGIFLFTLPGWAVFHLIWPDWKNLTYFEKLGLSGGMSLAIYPILILWTDFIGLHLGKWYALLPGGIGLVVLLAANLKSYRAKVPSLKLRILPDIVPDYYWQILVSVVILSLLIAVRFFAIRGLDVPLWGDSYHHTIITQLLVDNGGLFDQWRPYADLQSFTYHFGFHSLTAAFVWLTGLTAAQSTLIVGQMINILGVLALYPLAVKAGRNQWSGVIAILVGGLLLNMPMAYLNWGRYTQLAGLVILPVLMLFAWTLIREETFRWPLIITGWILFAALALTHYRVAILGILFLMTVLLFQTRRSNVKLNALKTLALGAGSLLLFLPWVKNVFGSGIYRIFSNQATTFPSTVVDIVQRSSTTPEYLSYLPAIAWLGMFLIIASGIWRREIWVGIIATWMGLVWLATNPAWLGLPGTGVISNFTILITAYIPASILTGIACAWLIDMVKKKSGIRYIRFYKVLGAFTVFLLIFAAIWGGFQRLNDVQVDQYSLLAKPDLHAFEWIRQNLPNNAIFLVNSFFAFGNTTIVGSDGGWWLPFFTGRSSNLPPMPYVFEEGPHPAYVKWVNQLPAEIIEKGITHPDSIKLLQDRGINYIYIGQKQGSVNSGNLNLDIQAMQNHPAYTPIYHQDRVWIFKFLPQL